jgi:hypothetical protein
MKLSSYQKLKRENKMLRHQIYSLVRKPDSEEAFFIKTSYDIQFKLEDALWFGTTKLTHSVWDNV